MGWKTAAANRREPSPTCLHVSKRSETCNSITVPADSGLPPLRRIADLPGCTFRQFNCCNRVAAFQLPRVFPPSPRNRVEHAGNSTAESLLITLGPAKGNRLMGLVADRGNWYLHLVRLVWVLYAVGDQTGKSCRQQRLYDARPTSRRRMRTLPGRNDFVTRVAADRGVNRGP